MKFPQQSVEYTVPLFCWQTTKILKTKSRWQENMNVGERKRGFDSYSVLKMFFVWEFLPCRFFLNCIFVVLGDYWKMTSMHQYPTVGMAMTEITMHVSLQIHIFSLSVQVRVYNRQTDCVHYHQFICCFTANKDACFSFKFDVYFKRSRDASFHHWNSYSKLYNKRNYCLLLIHAVILCQKFSSQFSGALKTFCSNPAHGLASLSPHPLSFAKINNAAHSLINPYVRANINQCFLTI